MLSVRNWQTSGIGLCVAHDDGVGEFELSLAGDLKGRLDHPVAGGGSVFNVGFTDSGSVYARWTEVNSSEPALGEGTQSNKSTGVVQ